MNFSFGQQKTEQEQEQERIFRKYKRLTEALLETTEYIKSRADVSDQEVAAFHQERTTQNYQEVFTKKNPLVSICVATYHKPQLLVERCIASLLNQTYSNIEIIVVGDGCTDDTDEWMKRIKDPRVHYENRTERGIYPENRTHRWMVAGTPAHNRAMEIAKGDFITHLDHDDEHTPDRVEKLVQLAQKERADVVYHPFEYQKEDASWHVNTAPEVKFGRITTSSVLYHHWLKRITYDLFSWRFNEPGDWNRFRRMKYMDAHMVRHPDILLKHYMEQTAHKQPERT